MSQQFRVGFCVSGRGSLCRSAVLQSQQLGIEAALVVGGYTAPADLESFCQDHQVPFVRMGSAKQRVQYDQQLYSVCADADLDLLCLTFDKIIPADLIRRYPGKIVNVHMALLPAFPGLHSIAQALETGVRYAGATIHEVVEEVDQGSIIAQCVLGTRSLESTEFFGRRLFGLLRLMYLQVIAWYGEGRVFKDDCGRVWVRDAVYGEFPISPAVEKSFPD